MQCPTCESTKIKVLDSRGSDKRTVKRRRECESCGFRYTTFEKVEEIFPLVVKKGGEREVFDRSKIVKGLRVACQKRPISAQILEDIVRNLELELISIGEKEVSSSQIGQLVVDSLKEVDQIAYVRFASVYKEFSDLEEFIEAVFSLASTDVLDKVIKKYKENEKRS